jgi:hypothetical protein
MTPAKMPDALIGPKRRVVSETSVGERFHIFAAYLHVSLDGFAFIHPTTILVKGHTPGLTIEVERREDGFHVSVSADRDRWQRSEIPED